MILFVFLVKKKNEKTDRLQTAATVLSPDWKVFAVGLPILGRLRLFYVRRIVRDARGNVSSRVGKICCKVKAPKIVERGQYIGTF